MMGGAGHIPARVLRREPAGEGVLRLVLAPVGAPGFPAWQPGAHADLVLPGGDAAGEPLVRQYSLCGDPADLSEYHFGILREADGRGGSTWVHDRLRVGDEIAVGAPRNHFPFAPVAAPAARTLFIAGGIGITPILPMLRQAMAEDRDWRLVAAARSRARLPFRAELAALPAHRLRLHCDDEAGLLDLAGLLAGEGAGTTVYSCGPAPLLDALQSLAEDAPWQLRIERFSAQPAPAGRSDRPFEVVCRASGKRLRVPADKSVLQVLREAGLRVESSCRDGVCGTCELRVLAGTPDHRDSVLTAEERAEGTHMMVCVSRAVGDVLELDI
ncbi:Ferredoxin-NADP reductase [Paracoccus aminovorans]|uniref:Ferredoxin-NADP reductase n=2 Tax=Paracoccus aminovorans TaxID=34004 RepID=A0A1I2ZS22_9RHOB|nr:Phthalate 4,5-dioxygenase [Paracoccus aminovorans]SFH40554.1 Ferredoxin-NADP reductase [Paracoccus aminovorans]